MLEETTFSWLKTHSKPSWLQRPCAGRGLPRSWLPSPSQHVVCIPLFPSSSPNAGGRRGSQQGACSARVPPASSNSFLLPEVRFAMALLYGVPGGQPAPLPSHRVFPRWTLQTTSALSPGNRGLCGKEFAGQRVELSCATLFLLAVTLSRRQHPEGFGNSLSLSLAPRDAFGPCVYPMSPCLHP